MSWFLCVMQGKDPISWHVDVSFPSTVCWRDDPFPIVHSWHPCWRLVYHTFMSLFLGCMFCSILVYMSAFMSIPYCFDYYSFVVQSVSRKHDTSSFVLSQDCCGYCLSWFHINFRIISSSSMKMALRLHWICRLPWVVWPF